MKITCFKICCKKNNDDSLLSSLIIIYVKNYQWQIEDYLKNLKINKYNIVLEPNSINTAASVVIALLLLKNKDQRILVLPIDYYMKNKNDFLSDIRPLSKKNNKLIILLVVKFYKVITEFCYLKKERKSKKAYLAK